MDIDGGSSSEHEVTTLEVETTVVRRGGRGRALLGAAVAVALVAGLVAVLVSSRDGADAGEALRAARAIVEDADGYHFEALSERHVSTGDPDGAGTDTTTRTLLTGTVDAADRWHIEDHPEEDLGMGVETFETIRVGDQIYTTGLVMPGTSGPTWVATTIPDEPAPSAADLADMYGEIPEDDDEFADEMRLDLALQAYLSDAAGDPAAVTRVVTATSGPKVEEQRGDGGVVLRATLAPDPALAKVGDVPPVEVVLELDGERRPVQARFTAEAGSASAKVTIRFSRWGDAEPVAAPADSDIDKTPWLSEEDLAAVDPSLLLAPAAPPAGLDLVSATVLDQGGMFGVDDGSDEPTPCPAVSLSYGNRGDILSPADEAEMSEDELNAFYDDMQFLAVTVLDRGCADGMYDQGYFDDELAGHPSTGSDGFWEISLGDLVVDVSSSMDEAGVAALISSMHPTTAAALVAAVPSWVAEGMEEMGGLGGFPFVGMGMGTSMGMGFAPWG